MSEQMKKPILAVIITAAIAAVVSVVFELVVVPFLPVP
jgi:hypothetical protein